MRENSDIGLETPDEHPSFVALTSYHDGELTPEEDEAIREHLAACRDCSAVLLELAGLGNDEAVELSEMDVARAWRKVRARLREDTVRRRPRWGTRRLLPLAAAALLALALPLLLRRQTAVEVDLEPTVAMRGTADPHACTPLPDASRWQLRLRVPGGRPAFPAYRVDVQSEAAGTLRTLESQPAEDGFLVELAGAGLPPDRYWLVLLAAPEDGKPIVLEQYCVRIGSRD